MPRGQTKIKFYKGFCELKRLREALNLTQKEVARQLGVHKSYYSQLESGTRKSHKGQKAVCKLLFQHFKCAKLDFNSLRIMRLRADLTTHQAAKRLNISAGWYCKLEKGKYDMPTLESRARDLFQEIINDLEAKK